MRVLLATAAVIVLASPSLAQTDLADSSGVYVGVDGYSYGSYGTNRMGVDMMGGTIGYRHANGLDYGAYIQGISSSSTSGFTVGPRIGYTHRLSARTLIRLEGGIDYSQATYQSGDGQLETSALRLAASAGLGRTYRLGGSVTVQPMARAYMEANRNLGWNETGLAPLELRDQLPTMTARAGYQFDLPISFRLLNQGVTLVPSFQVPLVEAFDDDVRFTHGSQLFKTGIRINF